MPTPFGNEARDASRPDTDPVSRGLRVVSQATAVATASLDHDDIVNASVEALVRMFGAIRADLWLMRGGRLEHLRSAGRGPERPPPPPGVFERATRDRGCRWVSGEDLAFDSPASAELTLGAPDHAAGHWHDLLRTCEGDHIGVLSLSANGRALGCMTVLTTGGNGLLEELAMFADQVASAMDKARLHRVARDAAHATDLQNRILRDLADCRDLAAIPGIVARHLDGVAYDATVAFAAFDGSSPPLVLASDDRAPMHLAGPAERSLLAYLADVGTVVRLEHGSPHLDPRSLRSMTGSDDAMPYLAALPLRSHGVPLGVVAVVCPQTEDARNAAEYLSTVSAAIAVGVDNAVMFTRQSRRAERLFAANEIAQKISGITSLDDLYASLSLEIHAMLGSDSRVVVHARNPEDLDRDTTTVHEVASAGAAAQEGSPERALIAEAATRGSPRRREKGRRACWALPLMARGTLHAVLYVEHPASALGAFGDHDRTLLSDVAEQTAAVLTVLSAYEALERTHMSTIQALAGALEASDQYTHDHAQNVALWAVEVGRRMGLSDEDLHDIELGAIFHDIGKIAIPSEILNKPDKLTDEEFEVMKTHTVIGEQIIAPIEFLERVRPMVRHEHERWDGRGYPDGISGEDIPLGARIIFVCDAYHAITSDRPYRKAQPHEVACAVLAENAGTQFDPSVVDVFLDVVTDHVSGNGHVDVQPKAA